jgi:hypothetical protein
VASNSESTVAATVESGDIDGERTWTVRTGR